MEKILFLGQLRIQEAEILIKNWALNHWITLLKGTHKKLDLKVE